MNEQVSLSQLNIIECDQFAYLLADIFERSPWIPRRASDYRPLVSSVVTNKNRQIDELLLDTNGE